MSILFYRLDDAASSLAVPLDRSVTVRVWCPGKDGFPPAGARSLLNLAWFAFDRLGLFARDGFAEVSLWRHERMLHRLIVTPRWYRFPFMAGSDLQLGDLWTAPRARGLGLARQAVGEALRHFGRGGTRFWYLVESDNSASIRLIESCGFQHIGAGRRTRPLGFSAIGRFRLEACQAGRRTIETDAIVPD
ncbi:MAG: GNAT family N-acetyltransferase [Sphingomonadales bacterium]